MWWLISAVIVLFVLVHLTKMLRLYLVLMEHKIDSKRFVLLYLGTTFVNLIVPYKLGELYRIYKIKKETRHWQVGILSVVIDRFFDILALFFVLLAIDGYYRQGLSAVTGVLFGV
ncbi:MAG: flippase-like domain-containing protein, partial [Lachnospiraceae bacterium]|nr:flippase-like domain-containing protein [Lachnospiraceae bacterium]